MMSQVRWMSLPSSIGPGSAADTDTLSGLSVKKSKGNDQKERFNRCVDHELKTKDKNCKT